jgi:hypothetical protein
MLNEIIAISSSLPIFYFTNEEKEEDWYILRSGFFVALSQFANNMRAQKLEFVVLENQIYSLDDEADILLVFGNDEDFDDKLIRKMKKDVKKATNYLRGLIAKYNYDVLKQNPLSKLTEIRLGKEFEDYLVEENLIEKTVNIDLNEKKGVLEKFILKSIGYEPGKCNIGPETKNKRLALGMAGLLATFLIFIVLLVTNAPAWTAYLLIIPLFLTFNGIYQYFFEFCVVNGLRKRFSMN